MSQRTRSPFVLANLVRGLVMLLLVVTGSPAVAEAVADIGPAESATGTLTTDGSNTPHATQAGVTAALPPAQPATDLLQPGFVVRSWNVSDGLPSSPVAAIARTPDGYLWLGTGAGLVRFDGARFVTLTTNDAPALGDNRISCLTVDTNGVLWIGTLDGTLTRREGNRFHTVLLDSRLRGIPLNSIIPAAGGGLWLATRGRGLVRLQDGVCDFSVPTNGLRHGDVSCLVREGTNRFWVVSDSRLMVFEQGRWQAVPGGPDLTTPVYSVAVVSGNEAWLATASENPLRDRGGRVLRFTGDQSFQDLAPYPWSQDSQRSSIRSVLRDRQGRIWIGTVENSILYWSAEAGWVRLPTDETLADATVSMMFEDEDGAIWMAGNHCTLHRVSKRRVISMPLAIAQRDFTVSCVSVGPDGQVWVGTDDAGVFRFSNGLIEQCTNGLANLHIRSILADRQTNLWVGTLNGLYRYQGQRFNLCSPPLNRELVSIVYEDRQGNLWAGTSKGLFRRSPNGATTLFDASAGLDHFFFRAMTEDLQGRLWVAIGDRGLFRLSGEHFEWVGSNSWAGATQVRALHPDADGSLWITTTGAGLFRFEHGRFQHWGAMQGLPELTLQGVSEDDHGNLWLGSENGILGCPKTALLTGTASQKWPVLFWHLSVADGLSSRVCGGRGEPLVSRSPDGRFWFPNRSTLAVFDPRELSQPMRVILPLIENVVVDGVRCQPDASGVIKLRSGARRIAFYYTLPNVDSLEQPHFRYRLEGNDTDWTEAGGQRVGYYGRLAPGHYRFRVAAEGTPGQWREVDASLVVLPYFWQTWWFAGLALAGLLAAVASTVRLVERQRARRQLKRIEKERAVERERARIAQDLHDDLGSGLTEIILLSDTVQQDVGSQPDAGRMASAIGTKARNLTRSMDEIVWVANPRNDSLESLLTYLNKTGQECLQRAGVRARWDVPETLPPVALTGEMRHHLYLASKEAIHNVVKHADATEVWIRFRMEAGRFILSVEDNGKGFDAARMEAKPSGNGLVNLKHRLSAIGGETQIVSAPGVGTTVRFVMQPKEDRE